ncbi:unnamed protein product [Microthlaspi erraticum]|uniref:Uncharacterized protein n=1 Tax=Microthlaspi erraticum TaxID=1685480 RepID=A0A6D2K0L9_9BRAS|nr:unnamed protein product [Microthlaspi erraticum]
MLAPCDHVLLGKVLSLELLLEALSSKDHMKRSYSQKSEDCSRRLYRECPNRAVRLAEEHVPRSAKVISVRLKSRPKFKPPADHITTRETLSRGRPSHTRHATRARPCRASREQASRPRNPSRTTADASVRAGKTSHVRPRNHRPNLIRPTTPADRNHPATTVPTRPRPDCPADRPDRPSERRGRPEAVFEAQSAQFKPKAGADLARLAFQVFLVRYGEGATSLFPYKGDANSPHTTSKHLLSEQEMLSPQAPPPSWDSPPRPSTLKTKKKLLPYLEAADLETSSQAASHQEEYLLATPEEEINPELIEFVKRDQFHDLFSDTSLAGPALDWAQHEPPLQSSHGSILEKLSWKGFARSHLSNPSTYHYSHQLERERDEEEWGGIPPHPEVLNEELIKHVERNPFYNSTSECAKEHLCNFEQLFMTMDLETTPRRYNFSNYH